MTNLSPAAQAVLDAVAAALERGYSGPAAYDIAAAALRAAADQLTPYSVDDMLGAAFCRNKILAIATELEANDQ